MLKSSPDVNVFFCVFFWHFLWTYQFVFLPLEITPNSAVLLLTIFLFYYYYYYFLYNSANPLPTNSGKDWSQIPLWKKKSFHSILENRAKRRKKKKCSDSQLLTSWRKTVQSQYYELKKKKKNHQILFFHLRSSSHNFFFSWEGDERHPWVESRCFYTVSMKLIFPLSFRLFIPSRCY